MAGEMDAATESRNSIATPTRCATADGRRHDSTQEHGDSRKKGLALKEMEQVFLRSSMDTTYPRVRMLACAKLTIRVTDNVNSAQAKFRLKARAVPSQGTSDCPRADDREAGGRKGRGGAD